MTTPRIIPALAAALALVGCSSTGTAKADPHPSPSPYVCQTNTFGGGCGQATSPGPPSSPLPAAPVGIGGDDQKACDLNEQVRAADDMLTQGKAIKQVESLAAGSTDFSIRMQGHMLADRYDLAYAARGTGDAFATSAGLLSASIQLATACIKAGWRKS